MSGSKQMAIETGMNYRELEDEFYSDHTDGVSLDHLKAFANAVRFEAAEEAWKELIKHGVGWELRKAVTDAIHAKDAA